MYVCSLNGLCVAWSTPFLTYCHLYAVTLTTQNIEPAKDGKDTSMTATMLLQDSMLKPSVFRSPPEIQKSQRVTHHVVYVY